MFTHTYLRYSNKTTKTVCEYNFKTQVNVFKLLAKGISKTLVYNIQKLQIQSIQIIPQQEQ